MVSSTISSLAIKKSLIILAISNLAMVGLAIKYFIHWLVWPYVFYSQLISPYLFYSCLVLAMVGLTIIYLFIG
jgi:hypothetical protein